ncbi:Uma2 family endonuclease [Streptomyces sp. NPDC053542]|uniref:Uma2 family endonuclease n=1 Tax=Streptomyces sp. NPDC053542 TaxID=3365710 RepID=UPI0037CE9A94
MRTDELFPEWPRPPYEGFEAEDLFCLRDLPPHTQLIDGSFVFRSRQSIFHTQTNGRLERGLRRTVPAHLNVRREMVVVLGRRQALEPDISVIRADAVDGPDTDRYYAPDVVLAVETVSPDSAERDRHRKPQLYADAGIPHFWRVEMADGEGTVAHVHELDPAARAYRATGTHLDRVALSLPFLIDIDLAEIDNL